MSKKRRNSTLWRKCENEKCQIYYIDNDSELHQKNCPPTEPWGHTFIKDEIFYFIIEPDKADKTILADMAKRVQNPIHYVVIPEFVSKTFGILENDPVLIKTKNSMIVKKATLDNDERVTSAYLTKNAIEINDLKGPAELEKLKINPKIASEIVIQPVGKSCQQESTVELISKINNHNEKQIFMIGNKIRIQKQKLDYKIVNITTEDQNLNTSQMKDITQNIFLSEKSTKWTIVKTVEQIEDKQKLNKLKKNKLLEIGGYSDLKDDLMFVFNHGLGKYYLKNFKNKFSKGVLLHGPSGVGKSILSEALLSDIQAHIVKIDPSDIDSKNFKETEQSLKDLFNEAFEKAPSVIFIEDIDILCPKKSRPMSDNEKSFLKIFKKLFDDVHNNGKNVMILALSSNREAIDPSLRRLGRLSKEFEMTVPTSKVRKEILEKELKLMPQKLKEEDINEIAYETHGFVGADINILCSEASSIAIRKNLDQAMDKNLSEEIKVTRKDFDNALKIVHPSAMKEVLVDIPNVKWSDIGGQKKLKKELLQSVEWPLKHPEAFKKIGIALPKGILMYGPPGCSKTMIAKALATESKMNFLNVKGPELFSKYVGDSEKSVRELFKKARQVAPCILFIDEIETLGLDRSNLSNSGGGSVQERVLLQFLTELDGFTGLENVLLVAATNRPDRIDEALLRPGRFDSLIYVPLPDAETRLEIFKIKLNKMNCSKDVVLKDLVTATENYSGAEIQEICRKAGMKALEENLEDPIVTKENFKTAMSEVFPRINKNFLKIYHDFQKKTNVVEAPSRFCKWFFWRQRRS